MDSSLLIEADRRHILPILKAYLNAKQKTIAPPRVYEETVTEPRSIPSFAQSSKRIEKMYVSGTIEIQNPNYGLAEISDIVDRVRVCIAKKSGKPLHMVEKADLQTTALVAWHATKGDSVEFIFHDRALKQCLQSVFAGRGISHVSLVDSSDLTRKLSGRGSREDYGTR